MRDDDFVSTPRGTGTAPLFHTVSEDGKVRLRRLPQGYRIHQPPREARAARSPRTPRSPVIIADSTPGESTPFVEVPPGSLDQPGAEPTRASEVRAPRGAPTKPLDTSKNTLPSRRSPLAGTPSTLRVVLLSATISALMSSVVFVLAYMFLLRGH